MTQRRNAVGLSADSLNELVNSRRAWLRRCAPELVIDLVDIDGRRSALKPSELWPLYRWPAAARRTLIDQIEVRGDRVTYVFETMTVFTCEAQEFSAMIPRLFEIGRDWLRFGPDGQIVEMRRALDLTIS